MPILEVKGLVKYYRRRGRVVDGVGFEVDRGEVVGLLGPNGAGKTTSFRMATGQVTPDDGAVLFNGEDVSTLPMYRRARLGMGYLSQETSVFRKLSVEQNILAILEAMPRSRKLGRKLTRKERRERTDAVLEQFGLNRVRKTLAARLSGGEKRRLEIARCLVCDPLLILLDEPFAGIDPQTITDIRHIVQDLRQQGIGILVTDHQAREILKITDRIYVINKGKVVTHGTPQQIVQDPVAIREYLGAGFAEEPFGGLPTPVVERAAGRVVSGVVEQERIRQLIESLRTSGHAAAAHDLIARGAAAVPALLEALERRDVELRRQVLEVIQHILGRPVTFDPYAPEALRRHQLLLLRDNLERKAG
jgi:lipopolysaccharide export system ATP-binding protein